MQCQFRAVFALNYFERRCYTAQRCTCASFVRYEHVCAVPLSFARYILRASRMHLSNLVFNNIRSRGFVVIFSCGQGDAQVG